MKVERQFLWSDLSSLQRTDEGTALTGTGANGFGPALPEQTSHGSFVRQTECAPVLERKNKIYMQRITVKVQNPMYKFPNLTKSDFLSVRLTLDPLSWSTGPKQQDSPCVDQGSVCLYISSTTVGGSPCSRPAEEPFE